MCKSNKRARKTDGPARLMAIGVAVGWRQLGRLLGGWSASTLRAHARAERVPDAEAIEMYEWKLGLAASSWPAPRRVGRPSLSPDAEAPGRGPGRPRGSRNRETLRRAAAFAAARAA
jgi:hypothetical protein